MSELGEWLVLLGAFAAGCAMPGLWMLLFSAPRRTYSEARVLETVFRHFGSGVTDLAAFRRELRR